MKTKLFKSTLSLLLVLMLFVSAVAPAITAAGVNEIAATGADGDVLERHASSATVSRSDLISIFGDGALSTAYYGFAPTSNPDNITYVQLASPGSVSTGDYVALKTTSATGSFLNRKPDWTKATSLNFSVKTYYNADFSVSGCSDGALYLNGNAVSGSVKLYTDETYTVTAADVPNFTCEVTGATAGEAFTPSSDMTIAANYTANASADITLSVGNGGTAKIMSDGMEVASGTIPEGKTFTVETTPNELKGYKLDAIAVKKNGEAIEPTDGVYGPVLNGEVYEVSVTFVYDPIQKNLDVDANDAQVSRSDLNTLFDGAYSYYGIAPEADPENITYLAVALTSDYDVVDGGKYYIYGSNDGNILSPKWTNAQLMELNIRTYYTGTFTVTGNDNGEVYLNGDAVTGSQKLYADTEYTVTAKNIDDYTYVMTGAEDGVAFTPNANIEVTVAYNRSAYATFTLDVTGNGTAAVYSNGEAVTERISEGDTFTVEAIANENRGYKLDSIVVTKNGEAVEPVEGAYGPVADTEAYEITVTFAYDPIQNNLDVDANDAQVSRSDLNTLFDGAYSYYGIAPANDPDNVSYLAVALTADYNVTDGGKYVIYGSNDGNILSPKWTNAKLMELNTRTYYTGTFTVTGNDNGEVYLNGEAVTGSKKLYVDTEYTVTAKDIDDYFYTMTGAEDNAAFYPTSNIDVTVAYNKIAYATFTLDVTGNGTAAVYSNGEAVTERISEGDTFTVEAIANENRGYKLDSVVVTKDGEAVEPVEGVYGPVADGEAYAITVTFDYDPIQKTLDVDGTKSQVSRSDLYSLFDGAYNYYGIAPENDPENISYLAVALTADYNVTDGGKYIIYGTNDGNILSPKWTNAKLMELTVRTYYTGTFTVSAPADMPENGEVYLNGEVVNGSVKLYADSEYTVTSKQVEEYICTVYGVEEGTAFTPAEDLEITASYMKEKYATISVNSNEGGTVEVTSNDEPVFDKIPEGQTFIVNATANTNNDYYVASIVVTKDGEEIEAVDGAYGPVLDDEVYEVTVTFAKATLTLADGEVSLLDINRKNYDAIAQDILSYATLDPEAFAEGAQTKVEYAAYNLLGYDVYEDLDYSAALLAHAFGTSERGGIVMGGNTEKVRVTYTLANGIELQATATVTVIDDRIPTTVEGEAITITYGDDLKAAVMAAINVYDDEGQPIEFTADDITIDPDSLNANLLSAYRAQEVNVRYGGSDFYAISESTVDVYVKRAQSSLDTKSETITYGETPAAEVITTPENLDYIKVIAGIDGEAQGYVSIDIPQSVKEKMQIKIGGIVVLDIYQILSDRIGEGSTLDDLKHLVIDIYDRINSNELIRQAIENSGFNIEILDTIMGFIEQLPDSQSSLKIRLGQVPENAGAYLLFAVSTDTNYTTSADLSYIIIKPQSSDEDNTLELRFRAQMQGEDTIKYLSYDEAQEFNFGGDYYVNDEITETDKLHTLYVGTTYGGDVIAQSEPVTEPGIYTETVYMLGGNYWADPIARAYTINRIDTELKMDDLTVTYDGEAHPIEAYLEDGTDISGKVLYTYVGSGYIGTSAPVNAGEYTVTAFYAGDAKHTAASATAKLTIEKRQATITVTCKDEVTYGDINIINAIEVADIQYIVSGTVNDDQLGLIMPTLTGQQLMTVGEYTATVTFIQTNSNYDVTIEDATLTIVPREVTVTVNDAEKIYGDDDPAFTYDVENLVFFDKANVTLSREEGENVGEYEITAEVEENPNYTFTVVPGTLTIKPKDITVTANDSQKIFGDDDLAFTYSITDSEGAPYEDEAIVVTLEREVGEDVGEYEITATVAENANYSVTTVPGTFTITPKDITVTIEDAEKVYHDDDPDFFYNVTDAEGEPYADRAIIVEFTREEGENVGEYEISATVTASNYTVELVPGTLTIVPKAVTVKADDAQKEFTDDDPAFTCTITDADGEPYEDDAIVVTYEREEGEALGTYEITALVEEDPNYIFTTESGTLTITTKSIIVIIDDETKEYNQPDPRTYTYTVTDSEGNVLDSSAMGIIIARVTGEEIGEYEIFVARVMNTNYTLDTENSVNGTLTITPIVEGLKMDNVTTAYDGSAHALEAYLSDGTDISGKVTYTYTGEDYDSEDAPVNAGEYTVTASYVGDETHAAQSVQATLTITKLDATITVSCKDEIVYGDIDFDTIDAAELSYEVSGTIGHDHLGVIATELITDDNFPNVGEYTATALLHQTNNNYNVTIVDATLTIVPRSVIVTIDNAEKFVDADDPTFTYTVTDTEGNPIDPEILGITIAREAGEEVGEYRIYVAEITNKNYVLDATDSTDGTLTIKEHATRAYILGDVDGDGEVSSVDATWIQHKIASFKITDFEFDDLAADVDGDGEITSIDATYIQRYIARIKTPYDIGQTKYEILD